MDKYNVKPYGIHKACKIGDLQVVTKLLDAGADVNKPDNGGETPLHCACACGQNR